MTRHLGIEIAGTGSARPEAVFTNQGLEEFLELGYDLDKLENRLGFRERGIAETEDAEANVRQSAAAGRISLEAAGMHPAEVQEIIISTITPDRISPGTYAGINRLFGTRTPGYDLNAACAGFTFALHNAYKNIIAGYENTLVVGTDILSRRIDAGDPSTAYILADGSGAAILRRTDKRPDVGLLGFCADVRPELEDILFCDHGDNIRMKGREVYKEVVLEKWAAEIGAMAVEDSGLKIDEIDWFIPHQANFKMLAPVAQQLGIAESKTIWTGYHHGNTSSASIPMALDEAIRDGRIRRDDTILVEGFGAGMIAKALVFVY